MCGKDFRVGYPFPPIPMTPFPPPYPNLAASEM